MLREEWRRSRQGKKVLTPLLRHRRSRLQPVFGQIRPSKRPPGCARSGRDLTWRTWRSPATVRILAGLFGASAYPSWTGRRAVSLRQGHLGAALPLRAFARPSSGSPGSKRLRAGQSMRRSSGLRISSSHHRPISSQRRRAVRCSRSALAAGNDDQAVATPCSVDPGPAIDVTRTKAVMPTAIAPMTEKTSCQVSDGMVCFTMPCVA